MYKCIFYKCTYVYRYIYTSFLKLVQVAYKIINRIQMFPNYRSSKVVPAGGKI